MTIETKSRFGNRPKSAPSNRSFRHTGARQCPVETMDVEKAATKLSWLLRSYMNDFSKRQFEILERRKEKSNRASSKETDLSDILAALAIQTTTGTGKTAAIRPMIPHAVAAGLGVAVICRDHAQIAEYADSVPELLHYHGRSAEIKEKTHKEQKPWTCFKYDLVAGVSSKHHLPQPSVCKSHCEHGQKRALNLLGAEISDQEKNEKVERIKAWFRSNRISDDQVKIIKSCLWLDHQEAAIHAQVVGLPAQSFSEAMSNWNRGNDSVERLVIIDESVSLAEEISVSLQHISAWRAAADERLQNLRAAVALPGLNDKDIKTIESEIDGMMIASEMCIAVAGYLGTSTGLGGTHPVPAALREQMEMINKKTKGTWRAGTAPWEKLSWDKLTPKTVPFRAASSILHTLSHGGGYVADGMLHVVGLTQVGEWIADGNPCILLDATLPTETRDIVEAVGGSIHQIHVKQNLIVKRCPNTLFGRGHVGSKSKTQEGHKDRSIDRILHIAQNIASDESRTAIITHKPWRDEIDELFEHNNSSEILRGFEIGHFGFDDRAHDRWSGRNLALVGGPVLSPGAWRSEYSVARLTALYAGVEPSKWPQWPQGNDDSQREIWIDEGAGNEVLCRAPLPSNPHIRAWVLSRYRETIVQAIGRTRGVRHVGESLIVEIWGGLPINLIEFGIDEISYHDNPHSWSIESHNEKTKEAADKRFQKVLEIVINSGRKPSRPMIEKEMRRLGMPVMSPRLIHNRLSAHWDNVRGVVGLDDHRTPATEPVHPSYRESIIARVNRPILIQSRSSIRSKTQQRGAKSQQPGSWRLAPRPEKTEIIEMTDEEIAAALGLPL